MNGKAGAAASVLRGIPRHSVPWYMVRLKCARCGGRHAPWWGTTPPPSCREGNDRENALVMFLETSKALGL